ncbi:unnamed protein product, partial [Effrenium voratum]
ALSWDWALATLRRAGQKKKADAIGLNSAARALTRASCWPYALGLLSSARQRRAPLNAVSSLMLVAACGRGICWQEALEELRVAEPLQTADRADTLRNLRNAVIAACEQSGRWQEALHLFFHPE